ncbi:hypothetical protein [Enhygromyxa salina]|uniref:hypothetical protein n=1 Tax=Enhygromyxa salina TaxID=215803 RepID=UPI0011B1EB91|nr:hypothetical protein [Enhygromyxa salina]
MDDRAKWPTTPEAAHADLCVAGCEAAGPQLILHHELDETDEWWSRLRVAMEFDNGVAASDTVFEWNYAQLHPRCQAHEVTIVDASILPYGEVAWLELELLVPEIVDSCDHEEWAEVVAAIEADESDDSGSVTDHCEACEEVPLQCQGLYALDTLELLEGGCAL